MKGALCLLLPHCKQLMEQHLTSSISHGGSLNRHKFEIAQIMFLAIFNAGLLLRILHWQVMEE